MEVLTRRLAGVHSADASGDWNMCSSLEYDNHRETRLTPSILTNTFARSKQLYRLNSYRRGKGGGRRSTFSSSSSSSSPSAFSSPYTSYTTSSTYTSPSHPSQSVSVAGKDGRSGKQGGYHRSHGVPNGSAPSSSQQHDRKEVGGGAAYK